MRGDALSLALYYDPVMVDWVKRTLRRHRIGAVFAFSSQMAPYALPHLGGRRSVMDFVDVDSEKWRQYAAEARSGWRKLIYGREARLLRAFEKHATRQFNASLFVSEAEAALFRRIAGSYGHTVLGLSNGVDFDFFDPDAAFERVTPAGAPRIMFSGAMDYRPNIDAVVWFVETVWPRIRAARPEASFLIVGSNPSGDVKKLGGREGVVVTGRVDDMRSYLASADVVVAPLRIARGIQNKVLEAMAMAKPVVATPAAFEGIAAKPGEQLFVESEPDAFADRVLELADQPLRARAVGMAARQCIVERFSWDSNLAMLDGLRGLDPPAGRPAARAAAQ